MRRNFWFQPCFLRNGWSRVSLGLLLLHLSKLTLVSRVKGSWEFSVVSLKTENTQLSVLMTYTGFYLYLPGTWLLRNCPRKDFRRHLFNDSLRVYKPSLWQRPSDLARILFSMPEFILLLIKPNYSNDNLCTPKIPQGIPPAQPSSHSILVCVKPSTWNLAAAITLLSPTSLSENWPPRLQLLQQGYLVSFWGVKYTLRTRKRSFSPLFIKWKVLESTEHCLETLCYNPSLVMCLFCNTQHRARCWKELWLDVTRLSLTL